MSSACMTVGSSQHRITVHAIAISFGHASGQSSSGYLRTTWSLAPQHLALSKAFLPDACSKKFAIAHEGSHLTWQAGIAELLLVQTSCMPTQVGQAVQECLRLLDLRLLTLYDDTRLEALRFLEPFPASPQLTLIWQLHRCAKIRSIKGEEQSCAWLHAYAAKDAASVRTLQRLSSRRRAFHADRLLGQGESEEITELLSVKCGQNGPTCGRPCGTQRNSQPAAGDSRRSAKQLQHHAYRERQCKRSIAAGRSRGCSTAGRCLSYELSRGLGCSGRPNSTVSLPRCLL